MTVATTDPRFISNGDGSTTDFTFNCKFYADAAVKAIVSTSGVESTPTYSLVNKVSDGNGGYSSCTVRFATAPASGTKVIRYLDETLTQEFNFQSESNPLNALNRKADLIELKGQRTNNRIDRALRMADGDPATSMLPLPHKTALANKALYFDSNGDPVATTPTDLSGTSVTATGSTTARTLAERFADTFLAEDWGVVADGSTDNTAALNALYAAVASAGGGVIEYPDGTIAWTGQVTCNGSGITHRGVGMRQTIFSASYTSGAALVIGGSTLTTDYVFENIRFSGVASQTFIHIRYVTNFFLVRCSWHADRILRLGDSSLTTAKGCYKVHLIDCNECAHLTSGTPTLHHIYVENFIGQWVAINTCIEGAFSQTLDGFHADDNIQQKIDHVVVIGGVLSRFRYNYSFVDARVVNFFLTQQVSERAYINAIRLEVTTSTSKNAANVGWENVFIDGEFSSDTGNVLFFKNERGSAGAGQVILGRVSFTSDTKYTPIYIESLVSGGALEKINIGSINFQFTPIDASQRIVHIVGGSASTTVRAVSIGPIVGRSLTTALAAVIRIEGRVGEISHGMIGVINATMAVDDQTSTTPLKLTASTASLQDSVNATDQSAAWSRPMLLQSVAAFLEPGYLYGCTLSNNGSDATNDIDIAAGKCVDSTNVQMMACAAMTKQLDANWAAGSAAGMRNSGAAITDTTYHIYAVAKADGTQDYYAHASATVATVITALQAETGGSAYLYARRIGSIIRSGGAIIAFTQRGDEFLLKVPVAAADSASPGTSAISKVLTTPGGIQVDAIVTTGGVDATPAAATYGLVTALDQTDTTPTSALFSWAIAAAGAGVPADNWANLRVRTDTSSSIRLRVDASTADLTLKTVTHGWIDTRGRLA